MAIFSSEDRNISTTLRLEMQIILEILSSTHKAVWCAAARLTASGLPKMKRRHVEPAERTTKISHNTTNSNNIQQQQLGRHETIRSQLAINIMGEHDMGLQSNIITNMT